MRLARVVGCSFVLVLPVVLGACGGGGGSASSTTTTEAHARPTAAGPQPATQMICNDEGVSAIATTLGVKAVDITDPTWSDFTYTCDYVYPAGARMRLTTKELDDVDVAGRYYDQLGEQFGISEELQGIGDASFTTNDGNIVVLKDTTVTVIDVSRLPDQFGVPPSNHVDTAINVAATIMTCWIGT
jgi:hypothetical protein